MKHMVKNLIPDKSIHVTLAASALFVSSLIVVNRDEVMHVIYFCYF